MSTSGRHGNLATPIKAVELAALEAQCVAISQGRVPPRDIDRAGSDNCTMSRDEAAAALGCSVRTVSRMARDGRLPSAKVGHINRFPRQAVERLLKAA